MKKHFLTGLVVFLPLALTFWIVSFLFNLMTEPFLGMSELLLTALGVESHEVRQLIGKLLALLFLLGAIIGLGAVGRYFFFSYLMEWSDAILHKIPVISSVYKTSQDLIHTIMTSSAKSFQQVVLVPFPHAKALVVGFVTRDDAEIEGKIAVFIPTTPNPTSGFLVMYDRQQLVHLDIKVDEALRFVISCGVLPTQLHKVATPRIES